jgi:hypothetical protein
MASPTSRTLEQLRRERYAADICERWIPGANVRADLFRMFDVLAVKAEAGTGVFGVQTTSGANHSSRVRKLLSNPTLRTWLAAGNRAAVWSWSQDHSGRWQCRKAEIKLADLEGVAVEEPPRPKRRRRQPKQMDLFADQP